jgi:UDP-N-acetylmuramoyl-tripeptide--D-alanyl-D-alanine ligase
MEGAHPLGEAALHYFPDQPSLSHALTGFLRPGDVVWFKASHGMHLEDTIKTIYEEC